MKPTAPPRYNRSVFATDPARGLSLSLVRSMRLLRRKFLWIAVVTTFILGCGVFAIVQMLAVPVHDEPSFEPRIGYSGMPSDPRLMHMITRAERDYNLFPIRGHRGKLRLAQTLIEGDDRVCISFELLSPGRPVSDQDRQVVERAIATAKQRDPRIDESVLNSLRDIMKHLDYVSYYGTLHDERLVSKSYFRSVIEDTCQ
jgi:hypothetical protein